MREKQLKEEVLKLKKTTQWIMQIIFTNSIFSIVYKKPYVWKKSKAM